MYSNTDGAVRFYYSYGNHFIDDPNHFHSLDDRFGILAYQNFRPWHMATATVGFDFNTYTGKIPVSGGNTSGNGTLERKSITEYSPYVTLQQVIFNDVLTLNGGLRMANSDMFGTHWLPQVGFTLRPIDNWSLKASVAKGYRKISLVAVIVFPKRMQQFPESVAIVTPAHNSDLGWLLLSLPTKHSEYYISSI